MTRDQKIQRLRRLIGITHRHGLQLEAEIHAKHGHAPYKRAELAALKALNARRRRELAALEGKPVPPPPHQMRFLMYDSAGSHIPAHPVAVACYADGKYENCHEAHPGAKILTIAVTARHDAHCLDIETGDATPEDAPGWVRRQHARGIARPVAYANTSTMPEVIDRLEHDGIRRAEFKVWTAHYTNVPHVEPGSDATQYEDHGEAYDVSLCEPWFL